ncbi:MAG: hypothetical protein IJF83_11160 [Methanobrevibacter sp.]|nr:hypothetical protein [Methanobrevibacter sp.]
MRYVYGTNDSYLNTKGQTIPVKQLASIIKRDVEFGKWNIYEGGKENSSTAVCRYKRNGFTYHSQIMIYGSKKEFKKLEKLIKDFIEVIPRQFN